MLLDESYIEFYKSVLAKDPAFDGFMEKAISSPEKFLYSSVTEGLNKAANGKTAVEIDGNLIEYYSLHTKT